MSTSMMTTVRRSISVYRFSRKKKMSNIKKAVVRFNGQELVASYDQQTQLWTATATAPSTSSYGQPDHVYKAEVFAEDQAGNTASVDSTDGTYGAQLKIRVLEKTKPEGQIRTPSNGSVLGTNTQNVLITVTDNGGSGLNNASFKLKVNETIVPLKSGDNDGYTIEAGSGADDGKTLVKYTAKNLADGANKVTFEFADNDGNHGDTLTSNFTISTAAPALNITSPSDNLLTNSKTLTVAGTATTAVAGVTIAKVVIKIDDGADDAVELGGNGSFSKEIAIDHDGHHTITIIATDSLGKTTQVMRNVTIDTTKPVITDIKASATTVDAGGRIVFTFKVTDANS